MSDESTATGHQATAGVAATGQLAGGRSGNDAMTAPGSAPAQRLEPGGPVPALADSPGNVRHLEAAAPGGGLAGGRWDAAEHGDWAR